MKRNNVITLSIERDAPLCGEPGIETRPLPSLEEFARFLAEHPGSTDSREALWAQRKLLQQYAAVWAHFEGIPASKGQQMANALADEMAMTTEERLAEERHGEILDERGVTR